MIVLGVAGVDGGGLVFSVFMLMAVLAGILFYFLPAFIAFRRQHHNRGAILAVNLLLGWSFIGWVVALIWSLTSPPPRV